VDHLSVMLSYGSHCSYESKKLRKRVGLLIVRLAGPDHGTGTGPDQTDFSAVRSQSKRPDRETVSIFDPDQTKTFISQAFINKLD
jgi:hypothetical protein